MTFMWMDNRRAAMVDRRGSRPDQLDRLVHENLRLAEENERLKRACADLLASAELWARLYEGALARANGTGPRDE